MSQKDYITNSNNINISKLTDNNSAVSKKSISSGSGLDKFTHLSHNSNSNFFLKPNGLMEMKNGILCSAELTQGNNSNCNPNEDHMKSNSSLPMFSPLKESDLLIHSKKITPRTYGL